MTKTTIIPSEQLADLRGNVDVLLVTATRVELKAVLSRLAKDHDGRVLKTFVGSQTYYVGGFGLQTAVVFRCEMGSGGRSASQAACSAALHAWRPRALIMVGIAFGSDPNKQRLCDVLVSSHLIPYELGKLHSKGFISRSPQPSCDPVLYNRLVNLVDWKCRYDGAHVGVHAGPLLSGEKVLDNPQAKARLLRLFPQAIGGEMEGTGVFAAAGGSGTPWILVKAICDWGDGTKTDAVQAKAARTAVSLVHKMLTEDGALRDIPPPNPGHDGNPLLPPSSSLHRMAAAGSESTLAPRLLFNDGSEADRRSKAPKKPPFRVSKVVPTKSETSTRLPTRRHVKPVILNNEELGALRLILTAPCPLPPDGYRVLFPKHPWRSSLRRLKQHHAVEVKDGLLVAARSVKRDALPDERTAASYDKKWVRRLEELKEHSDVALVLSVMYLRNRRYEEAVGVLTDIAAGLEPGAENAFYREYLGYFVQPRFYRRLGVARRVELLNAYGLCLSRDGNQKEALKQFRRLKTASRNSDNAWALGQAYINSGVCYYQLGQPTRAFREYANAAEHARRTKDNVLLGRALNNQGSLLLNDDPEAGVRLIQQGIKAKEKGGDSGGVVGGLIGLGNYEAIVGRPKTAIVHFCNAIRLAESLDLRHPLGLALSNAGSSYVDAGGLSHAITYYKAARKLGEEEGFTDVCSYALQGEAVARSRKQEYGLALELFVRLGDLQKHRGNTHEEMVARHDAGVMAKLNGSPSTAKLWFGRARRLAEAKSDEVWIFRCRLGEAECRDNVGKYTTRAVTLKRLARLEAKRGNLLAAGKLWQATAAVLIALEAAPKDVENAGLEALQALTLSRAKDEVLETYKQLVVWRRDRGDIGDALKYAKLTAKTAKQLRATAEEIIALDEQGCCYQRLGRHKTAEKLHRSAIALAERLAHPGSLSVPVHNLAFLLRSTGCHGAAKVVLEEARSYAIAWEDENLRAEIDHSNSQLLAELGDGAGARRTLRSLRRRCRKLQMWESYITATHTLANLLCMDNQVGTAADVYEDALRHAVLHEDDALLEIIHDYMGLLARQTAIISLLQLGE